MTGFAFELARIAREVERIDPVVGMGGLKAVRFDGKTLPVARDGTARIRFGRLPERAIISAADLITGNVSSKIVAGKIVIVGLNAAGTSDVVGSPIDPQTYGTMVQASAVDAILNDALIARPGCAWSVELALAVLIMALALIVAPRLRGVQVVAIAAMTTIATFALSALAFYRYGVMIDATGPIVVGAAACTTMIFALFANARRTLFEERLVSAQATGELNAARDIQLGMLPERGGLEAFDTHVILTR